MEKSESINEFELSTKNNLVAFEIEKDFFESVKKNFGELSDHVKKYEFYPLTEQLARDLYIALIRKSPELEPIENVNPKAYLNRDAITNLLGSISFQMSAAQIRNDIVGAAFILPEILDFAMQQIIESVGGVDELKKLFEDPKKEDLEKIAVKVGKAIDHNSMKISKMILEKVATLRGLDMISDLVAGTGPGAFMHTDPDARIKQAAEFLKNKNLLNLFNMLGRMQNAIDRAKAISSSSVSLQKVNVKLTGDITRALPSELAYLTVPGMECIPLAKAADNSLLGYEYQKTGYKMGPIIVCLDSSGSMVGDFDFWGKAVAICAAKHAINTGRKAHLILFAYDPEEMVEFRFEPNKKIEMKKFIEFAKLVIAGGTAFEPPLKRSVNLIMSEKEKDMVHSDIMFITDGYAGINNNFQTLFSKFKKENKVKMASFNVTDSECEDLKNVSDFYHHVDDFKVGQAEHHASELLAQIPLPT
jgi:uncharacterized protein with von Willebrand factor type A (vWA) domain